MIKLTPQQSVLVFNRSDFATAVDTITIEQFTVKKDPSETLYFKILRRKKDGRESFHINDIVTVEEFKQRFYKELEFIPFENYQEVEIHLLVKRNDKLRRIDQLEKQALPENFLIEIDFDVF